MQIRDRLRMDLMAYHRDRQLSHLGSSLSCLEALTALFWGPLRPTDSFVLSKGHAASLQYLILHLKGLISDQELQDSCRNGGILTAHPPFLNVQKHPWFGFGSGSLGYGLGLACGKALGFQIQNKDSRSYVLLSEGDLNEGSTWEALNFAIARKLTNLTVLLDRNYHQSLGTTESIFPLDHLPQTLKAMGWNFIEQDGHDLENIQFPVSASSPTFILLKTQKNRGIEDHLSPLEAHYKWVNS